MLARRARRVALLGVGLAAGWLWSSAVFAAATAVASDQLTRPASASVRVGSALFLAVTRAGSRLVAVGERGFVLLSDDGGHNWRQARQVPTSVTLTNVQFVSAELGWAVGHGGVVLHSRDGGESWVRQLDGSQAAALILKQAQLAAATGDEYAQWLAHEAERFIADGPDKPLLGLHFDDERRGWVVGAYGLALATDDGGRTWQSIMARIDNRAGKHLYDIRADGAGLVIAGEQGALFRADSRDKPFSALSTPYDGTFFGTLTAAAGDVIAYGLRGNVYRSAGDGLDWQKVDIGGDTTIATGQVLSDASIVLVDETGRIFRSTDGGSHFAIVPSAEGSGVAGITEASDGALILAGVRGMTRLESAVLALEIER